MASRRSSPRAAVVDHPRPRVGPARMQNSGPIGSWMRCSVQRATCSLFRCRNKSHYSDLRVMPTSAEESLQAPTFAVACVGIIAAALRRGPQRSVDGTVRPEGHARPVKVLQIERIALQIGVPALSAGGRQAEPILRCRVSARNTVLALLGWSRGVIIPTLRVLLSAPARNPRCKSA
jgi:hypothetical protein